MRFYFLPILLVMLAGNFLPAQAAQKKLIEFGWDEPDTTFLRKHVLEMEQTPFDGYVFHANYIGMNGVVGNFSWECWGANVFTDAQMKPALDDLKATHFRKFTHNFLRFNVAPGNVDWFDDFSAILKNARLAGRIAREGKCAGILFDIEHYAAPIFQYRSRRDAATKSWEVYAAQARRRGRDVMEAFQKDFPNVVIFLTYGYILPWEQSEAGKKSLADVDYGLLTPFLDGMIEASRPRAIIEGCESAYSFKDTARFAQYHKLMREDLLPMVANPKKYHEAMSLGFGIWLDYDWRRKGWNTNELEKNFYSPKAFEASTREALKISDEYVWIYTEQPHWWSDSGKPLNLPEAYIEALRRAHGKPAK